MIGFPFDSRVTYDGSGNPVYDRAISSDPYRRLLSHLFSTGIHPNIPTNMQVTTNAGMTVTVKAGFAVVEGCLKLEELDKTLTLDNSDATYPRIDTIVLRLNANTDVRECEYKIIKGTPATTPRVPELVRSESIYDIGLANIYVPAKATAIVGGNITDTRYDTTRCGVIAPVVEFDTEGIYTQVQNDLASFKSTEQASFMTWYQTLQNILDENTAGHLQNQIDELKNSVGNSKTLLADAITAKRVPTSATDTFAQMASNIEAITLGSGNAVRADVLSGKTFTNDDGIEYTGTMPNNGTDKQALGAWQGQDVGISIPYGYYSKFPDGGHPFTYVPKNWFGNASVADVVAGKTFTSQAGFQAVGTANPVAVASEGFSDTAYGRDRTFVTTKVHKSAVIVLACGYGNATSGNAPSITANGGSLTAIIRKANYRGNIGHGFSMYKVSDMPSGTTISINFGGDQYYYGYGQSMYIIDADF